jgi:raffinose/stachyose/melibiose transport system substrate-binding protein
LAVAATAGAILLLLTMAGSSLAQGSPQPSPITLKVWIAGEPGTVNAQTELLDQYQQLHPNVTIERTFQGTELVNPSLLPALGSGSGPDIWAGGTGPGQPASIINAGYALNLAPYYFGYGWDKVIPPTIVDYTSSDGKLWAIGDSVETTMFLYNKPAFQKAGITSVPTTWEELTTACDKLKTAGFDTCIGLGAADKWPISHEQSWLWGDYAGPDGINNVMFGDGRWDDKVFVDATAKLQEMATAGWFGREPLAVGYQDYMAKFQRGEIPMTFTGTFVIPDMLAALGADGLAQFGAFAAPNPSGGKVYPSEDIGSGWYINAGTPYADQAADLLNFMLFTPESRKKLLEGGLVPVGNLDLTDVNLPSLQKEALDINNQYRANGTIHAFLDTVMPANTADPTYDGLQAVIAGQMTPEAFNGSIQTAWEEAKAKGDILKPGGNIQRP